LLFNSFEFLIFAPIALLGHALLRGAALRWWLVVASYVFYGWANPWYCLLLLASTLLDFNASLGIARARSRSARRGWLAASMTGNLGLLAVFKYSGFFVHSINETAATFGVQLGIPVPDILLPIGISFYTFQTMSYTIDVYRGAFTPTRRFSTFALYVAFFPQLVAGPIERASHLLRQIDQKQSRTTEDVLAGVSRILWGLLKKVVFADGLAVYVNQVYADPATALPGAIVLATYAFAFQIYLDFSAYTDIAIGLARVMGIDLRENFRWPYLSRNIAEFWRRWHISLSTWLRDYLFVSIGGLRHGAARSFANAMLLFFLVGLWHGAGARFIVWGLWIGVCYVTFHLWSLRRPRDRRSDRPHRLADVVGMVITFHVMWLSWLLFRAPNLSGTADLVHTLVHGWSQSWFPATGIEDAWRAALLLTIAVAAHALRGFGKTAPLTRTRSPLAIGIFWGLCITAIGLLHAPVREQFIYFQF
jgi:alginate O-acetyltransferase complex protein AlgI